MDWLVGQWRHTHTDELMIEEWSKANDSTMIGNSIVVKGQDTAILETIMLASRGGEIYYIPQVPDQNDGQPVSFKLASDSSGLLTFVNPGHDYPQVIRYVQKGEDALIASIEGRYRDGVKKQEFSMLRINY